jgi:tetratricopeptide (TPR) repeat protein
MSLTELRQTIRASLLGCILILAGPSSFAAESPSHFEQANLLYAQGKFPEAASLYESMIKAGRHSSPLFFNLGNAYFRQGQLGRALFNYCRAERLAPRDPDIQANLRFTRERVTGGLSASPPAWQRAVRYFTLNEIATVTALLFWIWAGLVCFVQWRPALKPRLRGFGLFLSSVLGAAVLLLFLAYFAGSERIAIVTAQKSDILLGPIAESQVSFTAIDGTELAYLAERDDWIQVSDRSDRSGWVQATNIVIYQHHP